MAPGRFHEPQPEQRVCHPPASVYPQGSARLHRYKADPRYATASGLPQGPWKAAPCPQKALVMFASQTQLQISSDKTAR